MSGEDSHGCGSRPTHSSDLVERALGRRVQLRPDEGDGDHRHHVGREEDAAQHPAAADGDAVDEQAEAERQRDDEDDRAGGVDDGVAEGVAEVAPDRAVVEQGAVVVQAGRRRRAERRLRRPVAERQPDRQADREEDEDGEQADRRSEEGERPSPPRPEARRLAGRGGDGRRHRGGRILPARIRPVSSRRRR